MARVGKRARVVEQRRETRVVKAGVFFKLDLASPGGGENLGRLLGARRAGMDENVGKHARAASALATRFASSRPRPVSLRS